MTAANFSKLVLPFTLRYEGGRADNPRDPGGKTSQGITQKTFTAYLQSRGVPDRDVFSISDAERDDLYRENYWRAIGADRLPDGVDLVCFDYGVNSGPSRALKAYAARTSNDPVKVVKAICAARLSFDRGLAIWNSFGRGWTARVAACEALGIKMALHAAVGQDTASAATPGAALVLNAEAQAAKTKSDSHKKWASITAIGGATAGGGGLHPASWAAGNLSWLAMASLFVAVCLGVAVSLWRGRQHSIRSEAFLAAAKPEVAAPALGNASGPALQAS